jgi:hypothetical protein
MTYCIKVAAVRGTVRMKQLVEIEDAVKGIVRTIENIEIGA